MMLLMGPFVYCLSTEAHDQLPDEISPKLYVDVGRVMKYSRGHGRRKQRPYQHSMHSLGQTTLEGLHE